MVWKQCFLKDPLNRYDAFTQFLFLQKEMGRNEDELIVLTLNLYKLKLFMFNITFITSCRSLHRTPCYHTWHGMWFSFVTIACQCELRCLFLGLLDVNIFLLGIRYKVSCRKGAEFRLQVYTPSPGCKRTLHYMFNRIRPMLPDRQPSAPVQPLRAMAG